MEKDSVSASVPPEESTLEPSNDEQTSHSLLEPVPDQPPPVHLVSFAQSLELKSLGNRKFGQEDFQGAIDDYSAALEIDPAEAEDLKHKAILLSNRAACYLKLGIKENYDTAIEDCKKALEYDPDNLKALLRRAKLYELVENLEEALTDYRQLAERDRRLPGVMEACMRLPQQIEERNEKMKTEMMGKLKDLGNLVLRPFGLSTENFKMEPQSSGGYSVKFEPNKTTGQRK